MRYTLKYPGDAYARHFETREEFAARGEPLPRRKSDNKPVTFPRFKARHRTVPGFTIPDDVKIRDGRLRVPRIGWLRLGPLRLYADCRPRTVRVRREGTEPKAKWYAYIVYAVPVDHPDILQPAAAGALGLDRNVGQATDSTGAVHAFPDTTVEDAQGKRYQRRMARQRKGSHRRRGTAGPLRKLHRQRARSRDTATHPIRRNAAGHRPHGHHGRSEHAGHDAECAGYGREARPERAAEVRPQPCHPGVRPGTAGAQARVQGRPGDVRGSGTHCAGLQPVRAHRPVKPTVAGGVPVRGLRVPGEW